MSRDVRRAFPSVRAASTILADNSIRSGTIIYLIKVVMLFTAQSQNSNRPIIDIDGLDVLAGGKTEDDHYYHQNRDFT